MGLFKKKEKDLEYSQIIHIAGLDVPENCKCKAILKKVNLIILCAGNEYSLNIEKIKNVDFQMNVDEKQLLKSSLLRGAVGAAAFGVAGAVVGSSPKVKNKREVKCYAIISYENKNGENENFVLRDELPNTTQCAKLVDELKKRIKTQINKVEL